MFACGGDTFKIETVELPDGASPEEKDQKVHVHKSKY